jgi:hypothetical protein
MLAAALAENHRQLNPHNEPLHRIHIPSSSSHTTNILERSKAVGCGILRTKLYPDEILQSHFADVPEEGRSLNRLALTSRRIHDSRPSTVHRSLDHVNEIAHASCRSKARSDVRKRKFMKNK